MTFREVTGLAATAAGVVVWPIGWMYGRGIWIAGLILLVVGAALFYTDRNIKKEAALSPESTPSGKYGPAMPSDIHNYTGWGNGGRGEPSGFDAPSDAGDD